MITKIEEDGNLKNILSSKEINPYLEIFCCRAKQISYEIVNENDTLVWAFMAGTKYSGKLGYKENFDQGGA